ncbi:MAG: cobalamin biosynthesis protein CobD [Rhodospirillaceae bacterium]|jgi:adenosylcobinamide-phosphate synthase|nr:cobalamin biosynthesis protein CobD [Rhodospirillaceae bacterium]
MLGLTIFPILLLALMIDAVFGDPKPLYRFVPHPAQMMGWLIEQLDKRLNREAAEDKAKRLNGVIAVIVSVGLAGSIGWGLTYAFSLIPYGWILEAIILSTMIAGRSLYQHVAAVAKALKAEKIVEAREAASQIVGRDTEFLDRHGVARAAIESLSENFSDGVLAPIFWTSLFGLPGALAYKALNTADSMIGHRNERYLQFGWAAARLDDVANFIPARISALLLCLAAFIWGRNEARRSWLAIRHDAKKQISVNAGYPEAAMAGALNIRLAGPREYDAEPVDGEWIGSANEGSTEDATHEDISKGLLLYVNACLLSAGVIVFLTVWLAQG